MAKEKLQKTKLDENVTANARPKKKRRRLKIFVKKPKNIAVEQPVKRTYDSEYDEYAKIHAENSDSIVVDSVQNPTIKLTSAQRAKQAKRQKRNEQRAQNSVRHRRKLKKNRTMQLFVSLIFIAVIGVTLSLTVFFNIETINVISPENYDVTEIIEVAEVEVSQNLFRINLSKIEQNILDEYISIDEVVVARDLPTTLSITAYEAVPTQAYAFEGDYFIVSEKKRIIDTVSDIENYPDIQINTGLDFEMYDVGDFIGEDGNFDTINIVTDMVEQIGLDKIDSIEIYNETQIKLVYDNRITIELGNVLDLEYKLALVKKVIDEKIGVTEQGIIDAASDGKVYFRPIPFSEQ